MTPSLVTLSVPNAPPSHHPRLLRHRQRSPWRSHRLSAGVGQLWGSDSWVTRSHCLTHSISPFNFSSSWSPYLRIDGFWIECRRQEHPRVLEWWGVVSFRSGLFNVAYNLREACVFVSQAMFWSWWISLRAPPTRMRSTASWPSATTAGRVSAIRKTPSSPGTRDRWEDIDTDFQF